ncbi:MAG TPA: hypothetical protein ENI76_01275, partial [Ignavibacteria bacterium]|nr:hypothetical protein [Ignavibacteria bacterium]
MGNVFALDVAYVLKDVSNPDAKIINSLDYLGLSYDLIDNSQVLSTNFSNYKLILVGNEKIKNIPFGNYKSLIMDFKYYKGFATSQGFTTANKAYNLENVITGNLSGEFRPYVENGRKVYFLSKKKLSSSVTTRGNSTIYNGNYIIAKKDSPRSVLFGIVESGYWTNTSEELFRNSLQWVFRGEDMDGDGSFTDEDCNDNDAEINPNSSDVYKNCRNDAPIVEDINLIVANRSDIVGFNMNATDPEGDDIYYSINDSRFSEETEGYFTWNTTGYSIGNYEFLVTVTDGEFQVKKEVQIEIRNREPVCSDIPDIYWNEDQTAILDLNDYCSDPDGDYISYAVGNTSKNTEIVVESIVDGVVSFYSKADWFGKDWLIFLFGDFASRLFSNNITLDVLP